MKKIFFILVALSIFAACQTNSNNKQKSANDDNKQNNAARQSYAPPSVPTMITSQEEAANYIAIHFWDNYNFADTAKYSESTEQLFVNFLGNIAYANLVTAGEGIEKMMQKAEQADSLSYAKIIDICEKYLYNANSPYRNDELYIPVLQNIVASKNVSDGNKVRPEYRLKMALKNRIGESANNFKYTLENGKSDNLYNIKSDFVLIFVNNPGCEACKQYTEQMQISRALQEMVNNGKLKILAIYPDEDLTEWRKNINKFPTTWINAYDKDCVLRNAELYDLKAIPTLYLLDKDKKVILKDTFVEIVDAYFANMLQNK